MVIRVALLVSCLILGLVATMSSDVTAGGPPVCAPPTCGPAPYPVCPPRPMPPSPFASVRKHNWDVHQYLRCMHRDSRRDHARTAGASTAFSSVTRSLRNCPGSSMLSLVRSATLSATAPDNKVSEGLVQYSRSSRSP